MEETMTNQEEILDREQKELSPEEYAEARAKAKAHLEAEIEFLEVEKKYQTLQADIEEAKTRKITMIAQQARFFTPPNGEEGAKEPQSNDAEKPTKTLKRKQ